MAQEPSQPAASERDDQSKPLEDLTYKVIGCAMRVHNGLGPGLKEAAYQHAPSLEMEKAGLSYDAEHAVEIHLDDAFVGMLYLDHLVEAQLVVEEKAFSHLLTNEEIAQVITYLCATELHVGLLINFGRAGSTTSASSHRGTSPSGAIAFAATSGTLPAMRHPLIRSGIR